MSMVTLFARKDGVTAVEATSRDSGDGYRVECLSMHLDGCDLTLHGMTPERIRQLARDLHDAADRIDPQGIDLVLADGRHDAPLESAMEAPHSHTIGCAAGCKL